MNSFTSLRDAHTYIDTDYTRLSRNLYYNSILNKNSLGLLKMGAAKQIRIKSIEALVKTCG